MSDLGWDEMMAIPRLARAAGVTPRVLRYWFEQGLVSPTREHGRLRFSPRDLGAARLVARLLDAGRSLDELRMLKHLAERDMRAADDAELAEVALGLLYRRKAFVEATGMEPEHFPDGGPGRPEEPPPRRPRPHPRPPGGRHGAGV
jgi:DNA-binding transcriptional MerR regulator